MYSETFSFYASLIAIIILIPMVISFLKTAIFGSYIFNNMDRLYEFAIAAFLASVIAYISPDIYTESIYRFSGQYAEDEQAFNEEYMDNGYKVIAKFESDSFSIPSNYVCDNPDSVLFINSHFEVVEPREATFVICK